MHKYLQPLRKSFTSSRHNTNLRSYNIMPENRLAQSRSPYLLQHKNNPVDWYPWGDEAIQKAKREDKMIFLSVGYSTCHWCHVMAHESFESPAIAKVMNDHFVNVKVDREERPDIDKIYMTYIQATSGGGGWPMSVWLTPDLKPIVGGTYFPPQDAHHRPGFPKICEKIAKQWKEHREEIMAHGDQALSERAEPSEQEVVAAESTDYCYAQLYKTYDLVLGGFGRAPKFPRPSLFNFLFSLSAKTLHDQRAEKAVEMSLNTLKKMARGGIYDHLGGGFHRYSVTADWHVPHFEKMLYDQAQLLVSYSEAYLITKDPSLLHIIRECVEYVSRVMTSPDGGFYSAEDADSFLEEGKSDHAEGAFYVWSQNEIREILGGESEVYEYHYGIRENGNTNEESDPHGEMKGKNVLMQRYSVEETASHFGVTNQQCEEILQRARSRLFERRENRPKPHLDDKIITAWNGISLKFHGDLTIPGLMVSGLCAAYRALHDEAILESARRSCEFVRTKLYDSDNGRLLRNFRDSASDVQGFSDDYSFMIQGLLDLYELSGEGKWLQWSIDLQRTHDRLFHDDVSGGYWNVREGDRVKEEHDGAEPSDNSVAAGNLLRMSILTDDLNWREKALGIFRYFSETLGERAFAVPQMVKALNFSVMPVKQIVVAGKRDSNIMREIHARYDPFRVIIYNDEKVEGLSSKVKELKADGDKPTVYVCRDFVCHRPAFTVDQVTEALGE
ncbi:hypothetical protein PROFUN_11274 [Planoprotostelium fungivorum]|uniref:Spermatogenesis-associated protein 20-like TRX domain-containing protein n=1 Tax=Planoprotostelium fungivorum TaxID=1890364 RepID=A0A2P6NAG2_9EUKA|nr:hypothetical protein PROFUN_11274 [Planoprotostelium fungivorum]